MTIPNPPTRYRHAFTLVELLVVVFIIAVLISVLVPVIGSVRIKAYGADTQNWIRQLTGAIEAYQGDHRAYPGPIEDQFITNPSADGTNFGGPGGSFDVALSPGVTAGAGGFDDQTGNLLTNITGSENLVLGLLGGLRATGPANAMALIYDPSIVGLGPRSLNSANPKAGKPYLDGTESQLSWRTGNNGKTGAFADGTGNANDTLIPEFIDKYPSAAMPILYLRAKRGVKPIITGQTLTNNSVITNLPNATIVAPRVGTYDLAQIIGYTATKIGEGKRHKGGEYVNSGSASFPLQPHGLQDVRPNTSTQNPPPTGKAYAYPFDAYAYFENLQSPNTARNKDSYILISAGADRLYGTRDDIVNFGTVGE